MDLVKRKFLSTPLGVQERERSGTSVSSLKERLFGRRLAESQSLYKRDLRGHFGCVNAIEFSTDGQLIASGGDDRRLLLWNIGQTIFDDKAPQVIETLHISNINTCCFDADNHTVSTGGNDGQVIVHDISVRQSTAVYGLSDAVYCLSPDPVNATIIATATDDGKAHLIDRRMSIDTAPFVLADLSTAMHSIMFNPAEPRLLATANSKHGIGLWDVRMPLKCLQYKSNVQNCMSVRFNSRGDQLLALRRRSSPVLYDIAKLHPVYEFDYKTFYNACTLKSCSFAGLKDEYVMSGSDDFCIYLWKIPSDISENYIQSKPHMILKGHRSIVNQVRYCPYNQTIISSGVEKLIKIWSPYFIPGCTGHLTHSHRYGDDDEIERNAYSHEEYIHMVLQAGSFLSHDYTNGSTEEEPCMIAFFDSLIQREIEQSLDADGGQETYADIAGQDGDSDADQRAADRHGQVRSLTGGDQQAVDTLDPCTDVVSGLEEVSSSTASESEDASNTRDSTSSRLEDSSRPFFLDLQSSSDSEGEVDVILSAMYSRYMSARERALNSNLRPSGKKISTVIARGKQRDHTPQKQVKTRKHQRIRKSVTSMSILADVIDTFVDNLVATEPGNSGTLSDTNDGHLSTDSGGSRSTPMELIHQTPEGSRSTPMELIHQTLTLDTDDLAAAASSVAVLSQPAHSSAGVTDDMQAASVSLQSGIYFMPELQAFAPESFNAVVSLANVSGPSHSGNQSRNSTPPNTSSHNQSRNSTPPNTSSHNQSRNSTPPNTSSNNQSRNSTPPNTSSHNQSKNSTPPNTSSCNQRRRFRRKPSSETDHGHSLNSLSAAHHSAAGSPITDHSPSGRVGARCCNSCNNSCRCGSHERTNLMTFASSHSGCEESRGVLDESRQELDRPRISSSVTVTDDRVLLRNTSQHNHCSSSSLSSLLTASRSQDLGPHLSASRLPTDVSSGMRSTTIDASCNTPMSVQFKKAKVAGKRFRVHKCEPSSSSDEDE